MTKKQTLELIKLVIAEGDKKTAMRLYCENRISHKAYSQARQQGYALKEKLNGRKPGEVTYGQLYNFEKNDKRINGERN